MTKPWTTERSETPHQVVERHYNGRGEKTKTDVWEKDTSGSTTKNGHRTDIDGERYDHYGHHIGSAGREK
jgi:hypothetical protein